jgi:hypothetical protein
MTIKRYSRQGLFTLFLVCAFLPHAWTLILAFKDFSLLMGRIGGVWGAVGEMSYGLVFSFLDSLLIFLVTALLGFLVSARWQQPRRISLLGLLAGLAILWEIAAQAYVVWNMRMPGRLVQFLVQFHLPFGFYYTLTLLVVVATILVPALLILRNEKFYKVLQAFMERITLLSGFYLFLDAVALVIVIVRNV